MCSSIVELNEVPSQVQPNFCLLFANRDLRPVLEVRTNKRTNIVQGTGEREHQAAQASPVDPIQQRVNPNSAPGAGEQGHEAIRAPVENVDADALIQDGQQEVGPNPRVPDATQELCLSWENGQRNTIKYKGPPLDQLRVNKQSVVANMKGQT